MSKNDEQNNYERGWRRAIAAGGEFHRGTLVELGFIEERTPRGRRRQTPLRVYSWYFKEFGSDAANIFVSSGPGKPWRRR